MASGTPGEKVMKPINDIEISRRTERFIIYAVILLGGIAIGMYLAAAFIASEVLAR
jgi:hypothetical protein